MNPEQLQEFNEMKKAIAGILEHLEKMNSFETIPFTTSNAIAKRILGSSGKSAASGTQAVNEGGAQQYSVMKAPTGFVRANINGIPRDIPYL